MILGEKKFIQNFKKESCDVYPYLFIYISSMLVNIFHLEFN